MLQNQPAKAANMPTKPNLFIDSLIFLNLCAHA